MKIHYEKINKHISINAFGVDGFRRMLQHR